MEQAERPSGIEEREEEQKAEGQPDVRGVHLLGDRARVAAREWIVQLLVVPGAQDGAGRVVDDG